MQALQSCIIIDRTVGDALPGSRFSTEAAPSLFAATAALAIASAVTAPFTGSNSVGENAQLQSHEYFECLKW